jgi:hypothetical protein
MQAMITMGSGRVTVDPRVLKAMAVAIIAQGSEGAAREQFFTAVYIRDLVNDQFAKAQLSEAPKVKRSPEAEQLINLLGAMGLSESEVVDFGADMAEARRVCPCKHCTKRREQEASRANQQPPPPLGPNSPITLREFESRSDEKLVNLRNYLKTVIASGSNELHGRMDLQRSRVDELAKTVEVLKQTTELVKQALEAIVAAGEKKAPARKKK